MQEINAGKKVIFWGASLFLEDLILSGKINQDNVLGIVDKNEARQGEKIGKYKVYSPEAIGVLKPDVIISSIINNNTRIYPQIKTYVEENYPKTEVLPDIFGRRK